MRTINMFGRKMPIVAILMALLVIGTASAAILEHYAVIGGNVDVTSPITTTIVSYNEEDIGETIEAGGSYTFEPCTAMYPDTIETDIRINNLCGDVVDVIVSATLTDGTNTFLFPTEEIEVSANDGTDDGIVERTISFDMQPYMTGDFVLEIMVSPVIPSP